MMPSDLRFWIDETSAAPQVYACWTGGQPANAYQHALALPTSRYGQTINVAPILMWKMACHFMIDRLSQPALIEVAESLRDIAQFHAGREISDVRRISSIPAMGQVVSTQVRPVFELSED